MEKVYHYTYITESGSKGEFFILKSAYNGKYGKKIQRIFSAKKGVTVTSIIEEEREKEGLFYEL